MVKPEKWRTPSGEEVEVKDLPAIICMMEDEDKEDEEIAALLGLTPDVIQAIRESESLRFNYVWSNRSKRIPYLQ